MKILVTGHKGFIGSWLVKELEESGHEVYGFDYKGTKNDIRDLEKTLSYFEEVKPDVVVHLAALTSVEESHKQPVEYYKTNTMGTWNVVFASERAGVKRIVYAATAASKEPKSSPYALTKYLGEGAVKAFTGSAFLLRFFNIFGDGQNPNYMGVVPIFKKGIEEKRAITIYGDGEQTRDFIEVRDIAHIIALACTVDLPKDYKEEVEIGSGKPVTINNLAKKMIGSKKVVITHAPARKEIKHSVADTAKMLQIFNYEPKRTVTL